MNNKHSLLIELSIVAFISWWWFFVSTNVNPTLGNIYTNLTLGAIGIVLIDYFFGKRSIQLINPRNSWNQVIFAGIIGYILVLFSSQIANTLGQVINVGSILKLLASSAPVFSNSAFINFLTFGFMIAYIETYALFIAGFDLMGSFFNVEINKSSLYKPAIWVIMIFISIGFLILHVTAKGIDNNSVLILVFLMALISLILTAIYQDGRPALIVHIIANSIGSMTIFFGNNFSIIPPILGG